MNRKLKNQRRKEEDTEIEETEMTPEQSLSFKRSRQKEYSRRNRLRHKAYVKELEEKVESLELKNESLSQELISLKKKAVNTNFEANDPENSVAKIQKFLESKIDIVSFLL